MSTWGTIAITAAGLFLGIGSFYTGRIIALIKGPR